MSRKLQFHYIVKPEIGLVVCEIHDGSIKARGVAKCSPNDQFREDTGKEIARRRALIKYKKKEITFLKRDLEYVYDKKIYIEQEEKYYKKIIGRIESSIGKIETEIDNIVNFYSNE